MADNLSNNEEGNLRLSSDSLLINSDITPNPEGKIVISSPSSTAELSVGTIPSSTLKVSSDGSVSSLSVTKAPSRNLKVSSDGTFQAIEVEKPETTSLKLSSNNTSTTLTIGSAGTVGSLTIDPIYVSDVTIEVDETTTLPFGQDAYVINTGDKKQVKLKFGLPNGNGVLKVELVEETPLYSIYRMTFANGTTYDYKVYNGGNTIWGSIAGTLSNQTDLQNALTNLQTNITAEETARINAITAEATTRANADQAEATARAEADTTLQNNINTEISNRETAVTNEATARAQADTTLQANITAEETARINADSVLQNNISTETTARTEADTTLQANITAEAVTRASEIQAEATIRENADSALQTNITDEATTRATADQAEITARTEAINTEATTRAEADSTLQTNLNIEISNRETAITAEATTREEADTTLQSNITAEATTREEADTSLQANITAEATTRAEADTTLQTNINTEISNREVAVQAEATTRAEADTTLQNSIDLVNTILTEHTTSISNPHQVNKAQVGLGNVENLTPADMPISTATQTALDTKVNKNADISGATKTKITYDSKGLVTNGEDLAESDIPNLHLSKISDVTATASEVNILDGATLTTEELNYVDGVTSSIQAQLNGKQPTGDYATNTALTQGLATKQNTLTAGTGITITEDNVISSTQPSVAWGNITGTLSSQTDLQNTLNNKQDVLTAGSNIQINNNVISATDTTYTAGTGISIENNVISNTQTSAEWGNITGDIVDQTDLINSLNAKQDVLTAGTDISITNNTISFTGTIPTKTSDLTNDSDFITSSYHDSTKQNTLVAGSNIQITNNTISATDTTYSAGNGLTLTGTQFSANVINNVTSTSATNALSANMGKELQDQISNLKARGRFLSEWNSTTGLPETNPTTLPYTYETGSYFIVGTVGSTNYKPTGSQYTGVASTTVETENVAVNDTYLYDGTTWKLLHGADVQVTFASIAGQPSDNSNLASALSAKQDNLTAGNLISITNNTVAFTGTIPTVNDATLTIQKNGTTIDTFTANSSTNKTVNVTVPVKISDLTDDTATNPVDKADALTGLTATVAELNYTDGVTSNIQTQLDGKQATISNLSTIESNASNGQSAYTTIQGYGDIVTHNTSEFATQSALTTEHNERTLVDGQLSDAISAKQDTLVSGTNIKTINQQSILGSGDVTLATSLVNLTDVTITSPTQGQNLTYDAVNGKWINTSTTSTVAWGGITGTLTDQSDLSNALNAKQDTLTQGTNITISNNTISATDTTYTGGTNISIGSDNSINFTGTIPSKTSDLTNDSGFITNSVSNLTNYTKTSDLGDLALLDTVNYETQVTDKPTIPTKISDLTDDTATYPVDKADTLTGLTATVSELNYCDGVTSNIQTQLGNKQATLVSGTNIKTINNNSLLGSGNITIEGAVYTAGTGVNISASNEISTNNIVWRQW